MERSIGSKTGQDGSFNFHGGTGVNVKRRRVNDSTILKKRKKGGYRSDP